ncbi:hypothetical protein [Brachyspira pilosicoli]|uniref:Lipoprotein n=1 Tax=Brachyspira pilosicoli (strain ATCC BAA-1826 / 95/1000) TaxID=759914 RepID=D8IFK8_BRAP9|nr:hypothetical protein [Brachyspira pilosicoli]ADK31931.1 conserved hypothetical protein [Brachyspira pilosicoli 95/1000]
MKNTLLALMLVSSLFVISCGADATKPTDAYKSQKTEISSGTKEVYGLTLSAGTVDVSTFALPGEKVTEILEVSGDTGVDKAAVVTKNQDGGIYQFTTTATTTSTTGSVIYKYTKSAIAPIKEMTLNNITVTSDTGSGTGSTATINDTTFQFLFEIVSVTYQGSDITTDIKSISGNTITFYNTALSGNITIKYQYMDVYQISEKPTKEGAIEAGNIITLTQNDAGKTYICKDINMNTYYYGIVPATGIINTTMTQNNNYQLWLY